MTGVGKILLTGMVLSALVGCSKGTEITADNLKDKGTLDNYDTKSCKFSDSQGDSADFSALSSSQITKTYFDKEYNKAYFNAVAKANVTSTIQFIDQTEATVYKTAPIQTSVCSKPLFASASTMPSDLEDFWDKSTVGSAPGVYVLGLYLSKSNDPSLPSLHNGGAIYVRENASRWTVVHEFMHHLFHLRAVQQGFVEGQALQDLSESTNDLNDLMKMTELPDKEWLSRFMPIFMRFAKATDTQMVHFTLEEMTIEANMKEAASASQLLFAPEDSNWYIHSSAKSALEAYDKVTTLGEAMIKVTDRNCQKQAAAKKTKAFKCDLPDTTPIKMVLKKIYKTEDAIKALQKKYPYFDDPLAGGVLVTNHVQDHEGCAHEVETEKTLEILKGLTTNFPALEPND